MNVSLRRIRRVITVKGIDSLTWIINSRGSVSRNWSRYHMYDEPMCSITKRYIVESSTNESTIMERLTEEETNNRTDTTTKEVEIDEGTVTTTTTTTTTTTEIVEELTENDENEKYMKFFYEIYSDDKDTYDCPKSIQKFIKKEHIHVGIKIKCSSPRNLKKTDVKNVINNIFDQSDINDMQEEVKEGNEKKHNNEEEEKTSPIQSNGDVYYLKSSFKEFPYPDRNVIWPNPLVYNHRLQPFILKREKENQLRNQNNSSKEKKNDEDGTEKQSSEFEKNKKNMELNKNRLEHLWSYSSSFGISLDFLDELFLKFKKEKQDHLSKWENNKQKIMLYAAKVSKRKLIQSRKELLDKLGIDYSNNIYNNINESEFNDHIINLKDDQTEYNLLLPRSIFRKWTRTLYFYWKDRYMHYYDNTLSDYLKGEIVDLQLLREQNERNLNLSNKIMLTHHSYDIKPIKNSKLFVYRYIQPKNVKRKDNSNDFDLTGVEKNIYQNKEERES